MKKIELKRRNKKAERDILKLLEIDDSGFVIYPGKGSVDERTGSLAQELVEWYLYRDSDEKPFDANIFVKMIDDLKKK